MEIKPKFDSQTIKMAIPIQKIMPRTKIARDPKQTIPNGIYKIIRWESIILKINILFSTLIFFTSLITIILFATVYKNSWATYILPIIFFLTSFYKLYISAMEHKRLRREINNYREDLKLDLTSQPPFVVRVYRNTFIKQIRHNWVTFFLILNGSVFTLLLWWLKDFSWWIFDFKKWVRQLFWNPDVMTILFAVGLILVFTLHIFFAIKRKKRILEIELYTGDVLIPINEIDNLKSRLNKAYRRIFIIYLMIVFIIPVVIRMIIKTIRRK